MTDESILFVTYGKCVGCGKLTPPMNIVDYDFETAVHRMMEMAADRRWSVVMCDESYVKLRCPKCAQEAAAIYAGQEPPTVTMVTEFD